MIDHDFFFDSGILSSLIDFFFSTDLICFINDQAITSFSKFWFDSPEIQASLLGIPILTSLDLLYTSQIELFLLNLL